MKSRFWNPNFAKAAVAALAMSLATASQAQVTYTDWYGGGVLTSAVNCPTGGLDQHVNRVFNVFSASQCGHQRNKVVDVDHQPALCAGLRAGRSVHSGAEARNGAGGRAISGTVRLSGESRRHAAHACNHTSTTPKITMTIKVTGFTGFPNNDSCTATINATLFRP